MCCDFYATSVAAWPERSRLEESKNDRSASADSKKKLKHLEAQVQETNRKLRAKEVEFDRLREKLAQLTVKDRESAKKSKELLQKVLSTGDYSFLTSYAPAQPGSGKKPSSRLNTSTNSAGSYSSKAGSTSAAAAAASNEEVCKVFEALDGHCRDLRSRNKELELQVQDLLRTLESAENSFIRGDSLDAGRASPTRRAASAGSPTRSSAAASPSRNVSNKELIAVYKRTEHDRMRGLGDESDDRYITVLKEDYHDLHERLARQDEEVTALTHRVLLSQSENSELENRIETLMQKCKQLKEANESLQFELDNRPSVKEFNHLKYNLKECEQKLSQFITHSTSTANIDKNYKKYLSTNDRIRVDKLNHHLQLYLLDHLSKEVLLETVKDVCRELSVQDLSFLLPTVQKLKVAVTAIPLMEKFIVHMTSYVLDRNELLNEKLGVSRPAPGQDEKLEDSMEEVKRILPRWWSLVQQSVDLARFREAILMEVHRSEVLLSQGAMSWNARESKGKSLSVPFP